MGSNMTPPPGPLPDTQALNGPWVAEVYGTFEDESAVYIIMELCEVGVPRQG